jgi:outer membrane PBP1 activator LpoA protein
MTMPIRILTYLLILLLSGCGTLFKETDLMTTAQEDPAKIGKQLQKQGRYQEAAHEYLRLASKNISPAQQAYQLLAIQAFLKNDDLTAAKSELAQFDARRSYNLEVPLEFVYTKIDLAENRVHQARKRIDGIEPTTLPKPLQIEYKQLRAHIRAARGEIREAVRELMRIDDLLNADPILVKENHHALWRSLVYNPFNLGQVPQKQGDIISGWVALALLTKTVRQKHLPQSLNNWQWRFPNHPANQHIVPMLEEGLFISPPSKIALLLPFNNPVRAYVEVAEAIEKGFRVAAEQDQNRVEIVGHDVNTNNILAVYQKVVAEGADVVVGPLIKETLLSLSESKPQLPVLTLGLNHLETSITTGNLYQFGLSPEDEAKAVANRAWVDGHRTAMVLVPDGGWGERVSSTFQHAWKKQGGQLAIQHTYGKNFMNSIESVLRNAKTMDVDMAFMVAIPKHARQLRPLFDSILNYRLPIYSISRVYSGTPEFSGDSDLEGIMFVDMPWVLAPDDNALQLQATLQQLQPKSIKKYKRLYALGIDAYHLLSQLQQLNQLQWQGYTGRLSLKRTGKILRNELHWARFVGGKPYLLDDKATSFYQSE